MIVRMLWSISLLGVLFLTVPANAQRLENYASKEDQELSRQMTLEEFPFWIPVPSNGVQNGNCPCSIAVWTATSLGMVKLMMSE